MNIKSIIPIFLVFLLIFSAMNTAFAVADATIDVSFNRENVEVGDNVILTVNIRNTGDEDLNTIFVLVPLPKGLKFIMSETGTSKNLYNPSTGVWQVDNLRLTSKFGGVKTLKITAEVTPELSGKTASTYASFTSIAYGDPPVSILDQMNQAYTGGLNIKSNQIITNDTNKPSITNNSNKKTNLTRTFKNTSKSSGGINGNTKAPAKKTAYEITSTNNPGTAENKDTIYALIAGLIISVLIVIGYFKGVRN